MTTQVTVVQEIKQNLVKLTPEFEKALPPQIPVEKFVRVLQTAITENPKLGQADRRSLWGACMKCATDGLIPDGREATLVPFTLKTGVVVAQYMPMTYGILKKVRNSGELATINAQVVYHGDDFEYWLDEAGEHMKHKPNMNGERGLPKLTYAIARTKDGFVYIEIMSEEQIQKIREVSRAKDGPWNGPFADEMRKKTAIRRLSKRLPMSTDLEVVVKRDDDLYDITPSKPESEALETPKAQTPRLEKIVNGGEEKAPEAPASPPPAEPKKDQQVENIKKTFNATEVPQNATGEIQGKILNFTSKEGVTNGKKWMRWGVKVQEKWLGTFSESIAKQLAKANADGEEVKIYFSTRIQDNKKFFDIEGIDLLNHGTMEVGTDAPADEEGESII